jgi:hypothetical protein
MAVVQRRPYNDHKTDNTQDARPSVKRPKGTTTVASH